MSSSGIDVGIINYNGGNDLLECVASLHRSGTVTPRIFIFDNCSTDHSIEHARHAFPDCTYITSSVNIGYAGGINRLLQHCRSDIVLFCNMDLEFAPGWAEEIISCYERHEDVWSVAPLIIEKESGEPYSTGVKFFWDLYPLSSKTEPPNRNPYRVVNAYGAAMSFRRDLFERIGGFDEDYFLFFEETEFYLRMHIHSLAAMLCPAARIYHRRSLSTVRFSSMKLFYSERNRVLTAFKYLPLWFFPLTLPATVIRLLTMSKNGLPKTDGSGKKISRRETICTFIRSWFAAFALFPREWSKRRILWKKSAVRPAGTLKLIREHLLDRNDLKQGISSVKKP